MTEANPQTDPLGHLNDLEARWRRGLAELPSLLATLSRRYGDAMPGALGEQPLQHLCLGDRPFTYHLARLASGQPLPPGDITHRTPWDEAIVKEPQAQWARNFLRQAGTDMRQLYLDHLKRFWGFAKVENRPAREWATALHRDWLAAQIPLRQGDRTLNRTMAALATDVVAGQALRFWQGVPLVQVADARWPLVGSFVFSRLDPRAHPGEPVLLNTLAHGLESFESLNALHLELAERLEDERQGQPLLLALDSERRKRFLESEALIFEPFPGNVFEALQAQLEQRQRLNISHAWETVKPLLKEGSLEAASAVLAEAADLADLVSSQAIRMTRYAQLLDRNMPSWMRRLSQIQRLELILAMRDLSIATASAVAPGLPTISEFATPAWLQGYAQEALERRLQAMDIDLPPERIMVSVTTTEPGGGLVNPLSPSGLVVARRPDQTGPTIRFTTHTRNLVQLALENISALDWDYLLTARVHDENGRPIPGLNGPKARALVRHANVGGSYGRHLLTRLRYGPEAHWRRERHARLMRAKLRVEILRASHRGQLGPQGMGLAWLEAVLNYPSPAQRPLVDGLRISAWQLFIRATPVDGVYLIGPDDPTTVQPVLVYVASGPSRQRWRWFDHRRQLMAQWLSAAEQRPLILNHVALAERAPIADLLDDPRLSSHIEERLIKVDFFNNAYRSETRLVMSNADALSVSNRESNLQSTVEVALTLTEIMCVFLPGRISAVFSLTRALWAFGQAYAALDEDRPGNVLLRAFDGFANLFEVSVALTTSPVFGKLVRRVPLGTPVPLHTHYAVKQQRTFLRYRLATDYSEDVYEAQRKDDGAAEYYIHDQAGHRYQVIHDGEHWRVIDPRMPEALHKPIVREGPAGDWQMIDEIRWQGLVPDGPALLRQIAVHPAPAVTADKPTPINGKLYMRLGQHVVALRRSLVPGRYTVSIPAQRHPPGFLTILLRPAQDGGWQAKVRQSSLSSGWFDLA
ncbi:dermonecrotic toxin domain-containing protein [Pseudomonas sp. DC3000-4b1]|uniref:dermonecrotic toxin domain-containing protein n=1 Tax=unclassified Pseudomonas TaxID=196821 RepID=UPI003CE6D276